VEDFECPEGVLTALEVCPEQELLGIVRILFPLFLREGRIALICFLEIEAANDIRLDLLEV